LGSVNRAYICAGAAFDALFGIDHVLAVAFRNCICRAFCYACTAADAGIVNYIGHVQSSLRNSSSWIIDCIDSNSIAEKKEVNKEVFSLSQRFTADRGPAMKTIGLSGKSGTGKSYNAMELCGRMNIDAMIDDGLLISENRILEGVSAKKQTTKIGAVKTALFMDDAHREKVVRAIERAAPQSLLILGTSDDMIYQIARRLGLPFPLKIIQIEDITTLDDRIKARRLRAESGTHVIPAPTFQVKRQFSGYFLDPMKRLKGGAGSGRTVTTEKTMVRPTYSYMGDYIISDKVVTDIVHHMVSITGGVAGVLWVTANNDKDAGLFIRIILQLVYGAKIKKTAVAVQRGVFDAVEYMTNFNVRAVDVEIRGIKRIQ